MGFNPDIAAAADLSLIMGRALYSRGISSGHDEPPHPRDPRGAFLIFTPIALYNRQEVVVPRRKPSSASLRCLRASDESLEDDEPQAREKNNKVFQIVI
jgi:hypothetical protein